MAKTFLITLSLILTGNSILYSQITGIPREQKIEIVTTLEMYPVVLAQLDLQKELLDKSDEIKASYIKQIEKSDKVIDVQDLLIENYKSQIELMEKQLKAKKKSGWIIPALIGVASGVIVGSVL